MAAAVAEEQEQEEVEAVFASGQHASADCSFKQSGQDEIHCRFKKEKFATKDPRTKKPISGNQIPSLCLLFMLFIFI